uniref:Uncharacterized protein n=1 Tax=Candidatus Methanogaster sp. ANME-2c ERB4 TaxID=2759911 RepID=A0A7G9YK84_9EURY|nr:hypothetical protein CMAMEFPP_00003 [Methanosarcinales archaeon ANME-2c ERB4]
MKPSPMPSRNEFGSIRGIAVGCTGREPDRCGADVSRFGGRKGVSKMVASVPGLPQLSLPRHLLGFRVWLSVKRPAPRVPGLCAGQSSGRCMPASRNPARILLP